MTEKIAREASRKVEPLGGLIKLWSGSSGEWDLLCWFHLLRQWKAGGIRL